MGKAAVEAYFKQIGREDLQVQLFPVSSATVELAAIAVGVPAAQIAKTLTIHTKDRDIVLVMGGAARINNRRFKDTFHSKAKMMTAEEALEATGHAVGGVCPFGLANPLPVYLDESLKAFEYVYPAGGESNSAVKVKVSEFAEITGGTWVDVSSEPQQEEA